MRWKTRKLIAGLVAFVAAGAAFDTGPVAAMASGTTVTVGPGQESGTISPMLLGGNGRWAYNDFGAWDPSTQRAYPEYMQALRDTKISTVRYPGGTIANLYHWKQAIGPLGKRIDQVHGATGEPLDNNFGPDEYGARTEELHQRGSMVVNFSTGTPQEAADWVEYMTAPVGRNADGGIDWAAVRARNGHPKPYDIPYWEVGNEMSLSGQLYWRGGQSSTDATTLYALGGSTTFTKQRVGARSDYRDSAAVSNGGANQSFMAKYAPITPGTATVYVGDQAWTRTGSLQDAGAEQVYTLDEKTGKIQFGDGTHGAVPPSGSVITISYTSGPHPGFDAFYAAMKKANPSIHVCGGLTGVASNTEFAQVMGDTYPYDCVEQHAYVRPVDIATNIDPTEYHGRLMLAADQQASDVQQIQQAIASNAGARARDVSVIVSEYGHLGNGYPQGYPEYHSTLSESLLMARNLVDWIHLGIPLADRSNLTDYVHEPAPGGSTAVGSPLNALIAGPGPNFVVQSVGLVPQMFAPMTGGKVTASPVTGNPERALQNGKQLPALTAVAGRSGRDLYLLVVNQDPDRDVTATVRPGMRHAASASASTLNGPELLALNTPDDPHRVSVSDRAIGVGTGDFTYTFPAHSIIRIRLTGTE